MKNIEFTIDFETNALKCESRYPKNSEIILNRPDGWVDDIKTVIVRGLRRLYGVYLDIWRND